MVKYIHKRDVSKNKRFQPKSTYTNGGRQTTSCNFNSKEDFFLRPKKEPQKRTLTGEINDRFK